MELKPCAICGKDFEPICNSQKYCGQECQHEAALAHTTISNKKALQMKKSYKTNYAGSSDAIRKAAKEAAEMGLSYGQYTAKYGMG